MVNFKKLEFLVFLCLIFITNTVSAKDQVCTIEGNIDCFFQRAETNFSKENFDRVQITKDYITFIELSEDNLPINIKKIATAYQHLADINWQRTHHKFNYFPNNNHQDALQIIEYYNKARSYGHESAAGQLCNIYDDLYGYPFQSDNIEQRIEYKKEGIKFCKEYLDTTIQNLKVTDGDGKVIKKYNSYGDFSFKTSIALSRSNNHSLIFFTLYNLAWLHAPDSQLPLLREETKKSLYYFQEIKNLCLNLFKIPERNSCTKNSFMKEKLARAYNTLGFIYANGIGTSINWNTSIMHYTSAAELDDYNATSDLGDIYLEGRYEGDADVIKAIKWYNKTLEIKPDDPSSLINLGIIYYHGLGIESDILKSKQYFSKLLSISKSDKYTEYFGRFKERFDKAIITAKNYINENNEINIQEDEVIKELCGNVLIKNSKGFDIANTTKACFKYADVFNAYQDTNILAMEYVADFFWYGVGINKSLAVAIEYHNEIIARIENKPELKEKYPDKIFTSKFYIADKVIQGVYPSFNSSYVNNGKLLSLLEDTLVHPDYFVQSSILIATMKIQGWGAKKDIKGAKEILLKLKDAYKDSDIQIDRENILKIDKEIDQIKAIEAKYNIVNSINLKFPAVYKGKFKWNNDNLGNFIQFKIDKVERLGLHTYNFDGFIDYDYITEVDNQNTEVFGDYFLSGKINTESKQVFFDEFDTGNYWTFEHEDYYQGDFYGKFSDDYKTLTASYVTPDKDFGILTAKRSEKENKNEFELLRDKIDIGKQYALMIGNNNYENIADLETASADARSFGNILENKYGFIVEEPLIDATRNDILLSLDNLVNQLNKSDSLIIFYAGHGRIDEDTKRGYWTPVDGLADSYRNDISNDDITNVLKKIKARHILVIADSCYSGSLIRSSKMSNKSKKDLQYFEQLNNKKSRKVITSGGLEPVSDSGANGHSAFANAMLQELSNNNKVLTAENLYQSIKPVIMSEYQQTPLYNPVNKSGDLGGELLFIPIR